MEDTPDEGSFAREVITCWRGAGGGSGGGCAALRTQSGAGRDEVPHAVLKFVL